MTPLENFLSAFVIALVSGMIGHFIGTYNSVKIPSCDQMRKACQDLLDERLCNIERKIDDLTKIINGKVLGI